MGNTLSKIKNDIVTEDEEIIDRVVNQRRSILNHASTYVFLTDERIIYNSNSFIDNFLWRKNIKKTPLENIEDIMYSPKPLHSGGLIEMIDKSGNKTTLTPSFIGEQRARDFIESVRERI